MLSTDARPVTETRPALPRSICRALSPLPSLDWYSHVPGDRQVVERYIFEQFRAVYGANVLEFMPEILSLHCAGKLSAVAGVRSALNSRLFLEQYFARPIEEEVSQHADEAVDRGTIAEIGNLVATRRGSSQLLFITVTAILQKAGFEWVVFTATPQVEKSVRRLGIDLTVLGEANPAALNNAGAADWGIYYNCKPRVVAGRVSPSFQVLKEQKTSAIVLSLYQRRVDALAATLYQRIGAHDGSYFTA